MLSTYYIGIDLGTTNTVVAYAREGEPAINLFKVPQVVQPGKVASLSWLPSVYYRDQEVAHNKQDYCLPWGNPGALTGVYAQEKAVSAPQNAIISAKSWLAHPQLDIAQRFLPLQARDDYPRLSPVEVMEALLEHIRCAWDHACPAHAFVAQQIVVTLPASFDDRARNALREVLNRMGVAEFRLLEEPQAAFYHWLATHDELAPGVVTEETRALALVCDVGGGTTDFSLIRLLLKPATVAFERIATGAHLLLGGDNMDLMLSARLQQHYGLRLDRREQAAWQLEIKKAKETLLKNPAQDHATLTLLGRGSRMLGTARQFTLNYQTVAEQVLNGFVPRVPLAPLTRTQRRSGLRRIGLPYEAESAITRHLADFLLAQQGTMREALGHQGTDAVLLPEVVLFNGGVFYSEPIRDAVVASLTDWRGDQPEVLVNETPSFAVACGAVYSAQARAGRGRRIASGAPVDYFLQVGENCYCCILPKGAPEGEVHTLPQAFHLTVGQPASFPLLAGPGGEHRFGALIDQGEGAGLRAVSTLVCTIPEKALAAHDGTCQVWLAVCYSAVGLLEVSVYEASGTHYPLHFSTREQQLPEQTTQDKPVSLDQRRQRQAEAALEAFFAAEQGVSQLKRRLAEIWGPWDQWPLPVLRALGDDLLSRCKQRRRSQSREAAWWNLLGYCLRPGTGARVDSWRIETLWQLYHYPLQFPEARNQAEFWIAWRRVSAGLSVAQQETIYADIKALVCTRKDQLGARHRTAWVEKMRVLGSLEKIAMGRRIHLGDYVVRQLGKKVDDPLLWWMFGRVASRTPLAHEAVAVPVEAVERWLHTIVALPFPAGCKHIAARALALAGRCCDDDTVDIDTALRQQLTRTIQHWKAGNQALAFMNGQADVWQAMLDFASGESLPLGLTL